MFSSSNGHSLVSDKERDGSVEMVDQIARPTGSIKNGPTTNGIGETVRPTGSMKLTESLKRNGLD